MGITFVARWGGGGWGGGGGGGRGGGGSVVHCDVSKYSCLNFVKAAGQPFKNVFRL